MNKLTIQNQGGEYRHKVFLNNQEIDGIEELTLKMDAKSTNLAIIKVRCREINIETPVDKINEETVEPDIPTLDRKHARSEPVYVITKEISTPDKEYKLMIGKKVEEAKDRELI